MPSLITTLIIIIAFWIVVNWVKTKNNYPSNDYLILVQLACSISVFMLVIAIIWNVNVGKTDIPPTEQPHESS